jgi:aspartyl/asparaginyl beta-hydroxylase (cupin superfamily)
VNRVAGGVYQLRLFFRRVKKANRRLYYAVKYALYALVAWALLFRGMFS